MYFALDCNDKAQIVNSSVHTRNTRNFQSEHNKLAKRVEKKTLCIRFALFFTTLFEAITSKGLLILRLDFFENRYTKHLRYKRRR